LGKLVRNGHKCLKRVSIRKITTEKVQQWKCIACGKSYTFRKSKRRISFTDVFIKEAVKDFIQGRSSFAVIRERKGVSVGTLWVNDFGVRCMNPVEIAHTLGITSNNRWSGILFLDAKYLNKRMSLLLAVDYLTLDAVAYLVVEAETESNYIKLVDIVEERGYEIKAIVSDGDPAILALTQPKKQRFFRKGTRRYPRPGIKPAVQEKAKLTGIPHQWCCIHAERDLARKLAKLSKERKLYLKKLIHAVLFANTLAGAKRQMRKLVDATRNSPRLHEQVTLWIDDRWDMLTIHHTLRVNGRKIPRTSNTIGKHYFLHKYTLKDAKKVTKLRFSKGNY
jgi:hypothetical protein